MTRIGITGHRGLRPDVADAVDRLIRQALTSYDPRTLVGVSALADGADQLFAQAILDRGGQLEVVVAAAEYRAGLPEHCHADYDALHARASAVHRLDHVESTERSHMDASTFMIDHVDELFAVWDGQPARGYGGTADVVHAAQDNSVPVHVVWPEGATRD